MGWPCKARQKLARVKVWAIRLGATAVNRKKSNNSREKTVKKGRSYSTLSNLGIKIMGVSFKEHHKPLQCLLLIQMSEEKSLARRSSASSIQRGNIEPVNVRMSRPVEFVTENIIPPSVTKKRGYCWVKSKARDQ